MGKASRRKKINQATKQYQQEGLADAEKKAIYIAGNLPQEQKISHALTVILQATIQEDADFEDYKKLLGLIVIAWNLSTLDREIRAQELLKIATKIFSEHANTGSMLIQALIDKKQELFPDDHRFITNYSITPSGDGELYINAAIMADPRDPRISKQLKKVEKKIEKAAK
jgi:hypothetical protein